MASSIKLCLDGNSPEFLPSNMTYISAERYIILRLMQLFKTNPTSLAIDILIAESGIDAFCGDLLTSESFDAAMASNKEHTIFWRVAHRIFSYGSGRKNLRQKFYGAMYYTSNKTIDVQFTEFTDEFNDDTDSENKVVKPVMRKKDHLLYSSEKVEVIPKSDRKVPYNSKEWKLVCVDVAGNNISTFDPTPEAFYNIGSKHIKWKFVQFYFVPCHSSYSNAALPVVSENIILPESLIKDNVNIVETLTSDARLQEQFEQRLFQFILNARNTDTVRWNSTIVTFYNYLFSIQPVFRPAYDFSEATRRMVIDPVVMCAASLCGHTVAAEKSIWSKASRAPYANVLGYGPLDLVDEGPKIAIDAQFSNSDSVVCDFVPPVAAAFESDRPRKSSKINCGSSAGSSSLSSNIDTSSNITNKPDVDGILSNSRPEGGSFQYGKLDPLSSIGNYVVKLIPELDQETIENACSAAIATMGYDDDEDELVNGVKEAKVEILLQALCQLLMQMHDSLLVPPKEKEGTANSTSTSNVEPTVALNNGTFRYGLLSSGQQYLFFGLNWASGPKPKMEYFGRLFLPVFIYNKNPKRTSGTDLDPAGIGYNRVSYDDFERVVAAYVMMMSDSLRDKDCE